MKNDKRNKRGKTPSAPDAAALRREKDKARELRQSAWWQAKLDAGLCHYCDRSFPPDELTLDHIVPLARGGKSTRGNVVPACKPCNNEKKYYTPAELILKHQMNKDISF